MALRFDGGRADWACGRRPRRDRAVGRPRRRRDTCCSARWRRLGRPPIRWRLWRRSSRPTATLTARCRECYEFRLHRARGYGALKAILGVLAEAEPLNLTEIVAAPAAHAGLDEGLSVVARRRRPHHVSAASATPSTTRCSASTSVSTAVPCRRPTTTSCARSARTRKARVCPHGRGRRRPRDAGPRRRRRRRDGPGSSRSTDVWSRSSLKSLTARATCSFWPCQA